MDHHSSNHDKYRVKLEPDRSPEHGMALLTVDSGSNSGGPLPPPQASQASSSSSTPALSTSTETTTTSTSKEGRNRGPRRFICNYPECDKTFTTSGHLARHVRVHTGEKAFQCTFPGCESRFSRHDNMLQHYRNHIVRNARRRKKAFASAVASGSVGLTSKDFYDGNSDTSPSTSYAPLPSTSSSGRMGLYPPPSSSFPPLSTLSGPIFVHSSYSTLSHLGGPSRLSAAAAAAAASSDASSSAFFGPGVGSSSSAGSSSTSGASIAARRQPAMSPLLELPQASSSSVRPLSAASGSLDPRDTPFAGALGGGGSQHLALPTSAPPSSSSFLSPPLASPSVMDRPHTATTTSFFPLSIGGSGNSSTVTIQPPPLMHRHSYSALASQPVLEPITPTSELPSYPAYHTHPQAVSTPGPQYDQQQQQQYYFHQQHSHHQPQQMPTYAHSPYPLSPGLESVPGDYSYSPALSAAASTTYAASPRMIDGTLATSSQDQQATYFSLPPSVLGGETLYNTEHYGASTSSATASSSSHHFQLSQSQRQHAPMASASYPPTHPHSNNFPPSSAQNLHPHHAGSTPLASTIGTAPFPSPVIPRNTISHSSLGSHNPLLSGLGLPGDDDLTASARSSSLSTSIGTGTNASHLAPPSEAATTPGEVNYTTSGSGPSSIVGTARWLRSPSAATDYASAQGQGQGHLQGHSQSHLPGGMDYSQGHAGWQPDMSGDYIITTTQTSDNYHASTPSSLASIPSAPSSVIGDQQTLSMADPDERAYRQAVLEDQAFGFHEQVTWGPYTAEP